jgi:hypothetical protein
MKSINLNFEDLTPWLKQAPPFISPTRKFHPTSTHTTLHKRASTTSSNHKNSTPEPISLNNEYIKNAFKHREKVTPQGNSIENMTKSNHSTLQKKSNEGFLNTIKDLTVDNLCTESECANEIQFVNHQYFPYRLPGNTHMMKSLKPGNQKSTFIYKIKKIKPRSCTPVIKTNYFFWGQRKLVASRLSQSPKPKIK